MIQWMIMHYQTNEWVNVNNDDIILQEEEAEANEETTINIHINGIF